ncbi:MAG: nuclear transport factor 2 family protein [Sphingobium sp.]
MAGNDQLDRNAIDSLIQRERTARDTGRWDEMADCYHPDSLVEVSWFQGPGKEFAERSSKIAGGKVYTFHQMSPAVVTLNGDRALAETSCSIHGLTELDGVEIDILSHGRLLWRALRHGDAWLIAGMRVYYIADMILPMNPAHPPVIDQDIFGKMRKSYRSIAYSMARSGFEVRDDLPGIDRPETVEALRAQEERWLAEG